jgi:hypothetical protein
MTLVIILFGAFILLAGLVILISPETIFIYLRQNYQKIEIYALAIVVRLILGALLVYQASVSKFPLVIGLLGWLSLIAAIIFAVMGHNRFSQLMSWALNSLSRFPRIAGVFACALGLFLVYAIV